MANSVATVASLEGQAWAKGPDGKLRPLKVGDTVTAEEVVITATVDGSMETVVRIYAPSKDEELARVVAPDGRLIIVTPGAEHLIGLRKAIYKEVRPYQTPKTPKGFSEICQSRVSFGLDVASGELSNALLDMTPFAWKFGVIDVGAISAPGIADQADFLIHIYKPNH